MNPKLSVRVRNAYKSYGDKLILDNLQMSVEKGTIYGLLGASGCGKTTLLSCIVGRKKFTEGEVWVLGDTPGRKGSGVPGPRIGYMPQDIALTAEFTVKDAIYFFGRLLEVNEKIIHERFEMFSNLLELPPENRYIKNCSGGQKRRVSFAAAMINMPELLILDEPTAGVDPVLRDSIWNYLTEITKKYGTSVIITTHYIEEARQAHKIGLMRGGKLLAEESPARLMRAFMTDNLEDVFLILSKRQEEGRLGLENLKALEDSTVISTDEIQELEMETKKPTEKKYSTSIFNFRRATTLFDKNWKQFYRNVWGAVFLLLLPIIQVVFFLLAIGNDIKGIPLAIVNHEVLGNNCSNVNLNYSAFREGDDICHLEYMSCNFINYIETPMIKKEYYENLTEAFELVKHGKAVGVLYMAENFTESLQDRLNYQFHTADEVIDYSEIKAWFDMSNQQIGTTIKYKLYQIFFDFQSDVMKLCNYSDNIGNVPVRIEEEMYGDSKETYINFAYPGSMITIMFFMGTLMTSHIMITDRTEGIWDRTAVAGVTSLEIVITHLILQSMILFVQLLEVLILVYQIFNFTYKGSIWSIGLIFYIEGIAGMTFGFWMSIVCGDYSTSNIVSNGAFYIIILSSGILWPLEAMPKFLQWVALSLPYTVAIDSSKNIIAKGWEITDWQVWKGLGVSFIWILLFSITSIFLIKKNQ